MRQNKKTGGSPARRKKGRIPESSDTRGETCPFSRKARESGEKKLRGGEYSLRFPREGKKSESMRRLMQEGEKVQDKNRKKRRLHGEPIKKRTHSPLEKISLKGKR